MIIIAELYWKGEIHSPVNGAIIKTVSLALPDEKIIFFGDVWQIKAIKSIIGDETNKNIEYVPVALLDESAGWISQFIHHFLFFIKRIREFAKNEHLFFIILYGTGPLIRTCSVVPRFFKGRKINSQIFLHGNLNEIQGWVPWNPFLRWLSLRASLKGSLNAPVRFVILEKAIINVIQKELPCISNSTDLIPHPIPTNEVNPDPYCMNELPIKIGMMGLMTWSKGLKTFLNIADVLKKKGLAIELHIIGRLHREIQGIDLSNVKTFITNGLMPRPEYLKKIRNLHYVCLPYQGNYYRYSASGVLLDAIAANKPIIATRMPIIEELFREAGDIGYLCENECDIEQVIINIGLNFERNHYESQVKRVKNVSKTRLPEMLSEKYKKIINTSYSSL